MKHQNVNNIILYELKSEEAADNNIILAYTIVVQCLIIKIKWMK